MKFSPLSAVSPIDGRYQSQTQPLSLYFSESALIKYRTRVEIEYFIALCELPLPQLETFDKAHFSEIRKIYENFNEADAENIKGKEKITNHDVKAVEYFIKEKFDKLGLGAYREFIHFGLTSQDRVIRAYREASLAEDALDGGGPALPPVGLAVGKDEDGDRPR